MIHRKKLLESDIKTYVGIDNGVSGSIGIIASNKPYLFPMPTKSQQSYTKARQLITRVDFPRLVTILQSAYKENMLVLIERPMVNPGRFKATGSALRCLESVLIALEMLVLPYQYVDSKEWQREILPKGTAKEELKVASLDIGRRLFPNVEWKGFKDADSLLMAEWARRKKL